MKQAIIDTGVLRNLYYLKLTQNLNLFYDQILVPREVEREFFNMSDNDEKNSRFNYLINFYEIHQNWFRKCNFYENDLIDIYLADINKETRKIHRGEAEVFVQNQILNNISELLFDEKNARKHASNLKVQAHGSLYILALIDLKLKGCDYFECTQKLKENHNVFFSDVVISKVFAEIKKTIG